MMNTYENLREHFGDQLAARIYGCALIMRDNTEKLADADDETAVRFTIGALKRRRIQGGRKVLTWLEAVEKLELEQDEGRHYGIAQYADRDIARIEAINKHGYTNRDGVDITTGPQARQEAQAAAVAKLALMLQVEADRYNADPVMQAAVKQWVADYMANVSKTKLAFIRRVSADIEAGRGISRNDAQNIRLRYAPAGVSAGEFMELIARYA